MSNGKDAFAVLKVEAFDLVLTDIRMPFIDGIELLGKINELGIDVAVAFISSYDEFEYARKGLVLGAFDYLLKPVDYEEFGACIDNLKIARFQKTVTEAPTEQGERTITVLTRYLQAHLAEDISLGMLSDEFHLSAQYISQLFKSEIGVMFILMSLLCRHGAELSGTERA